jgi:thiol-disulfide isomerase/thioredoxin
MVRKILGGIFILTFSMLTQLALAKAETLDIYGKPHNYAQVKGQWIIINYWADWCHACVEEIPELNKLAKLVKNKPVVFFGVNYDALPDQNQQEFAQHFQINYTLLRDNPFKASMPHNQITSLPVTYIISPDGQMQELNGEVQISEILRIIG